MPASLVSAFARAAAAPFFLALLVWPSACASIPQGGAAVDSVTIIGAKAIDPSELTDKLATTGSAKFLGLFRGVANDYSIYDPSALQRDVARVERFYRGRGFFEARARSARVIHVSANHVRVEIVVDEGLPVLNRETRIDGIEELSSSTAAAVRAAGEGALPKGSRFDETAYRDGQAALLRSLTSRGYAYANVHANAHVDLPAHAIDYEFAISPGVASVYGPITFVGLDPDGAGPRPQEINEKVLRRVMNVREGTPYSTAEIDTLTQALLDLEVFSAVHVVPGLSDPPKPSVPLVIQVEPTQLRQVRLGAGGELDEIKTDAHLIAGWEDHNLLGGLRDFSVDLRPGVVFYPTSLSDFRIPKRFFYEQHLRLQFRQPAVIEARTTAFVRPELNIYPLLVEPNPIDTNVVPNYIEPKVSVGLERRFGRHLFSTLAYNFQGEKPFTYPGQQLDAALPTVLLSFPQLVTQIDFRDDPIHTHVGFAADLDLQVAGGPFGGTATDWRIQPDVEGYIPITRNVTFAVSGTLGLLFPLNYGQSVETGLPAAASATDIQTVYFRGFFSGGPNSNRGYPLRGVAPHGFVPFLNPATAATQAANNCDPTKVPPDALQKNPLCSSPIGGFTQWEASAELRFALSGPLGAVLFCDAGDVSQYVLFQKYRSAPDARALRFNYLHMSCGVGARYDTSVVPIRLDVGYRIPGMQILGKSDPTQYDATFGVAPNLFTVLPIAVAFGIGESF
jgi:outer membrane protein assembly factor BamA